MPLSKSHQRKEERSQGPSYCTVLLLLYLCFSLDAFVSLFASLVASQSVKERGRGKRTWYQQPMACSDLSFSVPSASYQCLRVLHQRALLITSYSYIRDTINTDRVARSGYSYTKIDRQTFLISMHGTYLVILTTMNGQNKYFTFTSVR